MKRLFYTFAVLVAVIAALALNLRAAHVYALFPERSAALVSVVSGHSGLRTGRVLIAPGWSGTWAEGRLCGMDPCWTVALSDPSGSELAGTARLEIAGLRLRLEEIGGLLRGATDLPTLGAVRSAIRFDAGHIDLAILSQTVLSGEATGRIEQLDLQGLALGTGPVTLSVAAQNRIRISVRLDGGPSRIEAEIGIDLDASEGTVDVTFDNLDGYPADLQRVLMRATSPEDGSGRRLRLRFAL